MRSSKHTHDETTGRTSRINNSLLMDICSAIREIKYGSVTIHIQDGKIVQIDRLSKFRMLE